MQKWEYCVIAGVTSSPIGGFSGHYPKLSYLPQNGWGKVVDLGNHGKKDRPAGFVNLSEEGYIAHTIAELGMTGWELVGVGQQETVSGTVGYQTLYFKRPLAE